MCADRACLDWGDDAGMLTYAPSMKCPIAVLHPWLHRYDAGEAPLIRSYICDCLESYCIKHAVL